MKQRRRLWDRLMRKSRQTAPVNHDTREPLNQEQLKSLRLREQEATRGPWNVEQHVVDEFVTDRSILTAYHDETLKWPLPIVGTHQSHHGIGSWIEAADAEFIAHSRTDIPSLLATLNVFAHPKVYDALLRFYRSNECPPEAKEAIERALDVAWNLMKSNP